MKHFIVSILIALISSVGIGGVNDASGAPLAETQDGTAEAHNDIVETQGEATETRDNITLWEEANAVYYANDFALASALYDSIERSGMVSAKLYYNKAGALFKMGKIGESILYYSKAKRLAPSDPDIAHNLAIAATYTRNHIEPVPDFFLKRWMNALGATMSGNTWAWLSIASLVLTLTGALLYLLPLGRRMRKTGFYGGLSALVLLIFAFSFACRDWSETVHPTGGVVTAPSAAVKSSPDSSGKDLFLLYEGDRVRVIDVMNGWNEITVANGNRGWIRSGSVSMID